MVLLAAAPAVMAFACGTTEAVPKTASNLAPASEAPPKQIPVSFVNYARFPDEHGQPLVHPDIDAHREAVEHASPTREPAKPACQDA